MIVSFNDLYNAYRRCKKNKSNNINAIEFEMHLIDNLWKLYEEINSWKYRPSSYICFIVNSPKLREVFASNFRDRVIHHLLVSDLEPTFEKIFIYDSYSCRDNKGTHNAMKRVQSFSRKKKNRYYMQLDIKNFFLSINKNILFDRIKEIVLKKDIDNLQRVLFLSNKIIFDNPSSKFSYRGDFSKHKNIPKHKSLFFTPINKGLPIGNLTSQFFANIYLDIMDNYIKRVLKVKCYARYVDDFVLFGENKEILLEQKFKIEEFIYKRLELKLRDDFRVRKVESGIDFLGYIIRPNYILVRNRVVNNFKYKKAKFLKNSFRNGFCSLEEAKKFKEINASYYGHFKWANSYKLMKKYKLNEWL